MPVKTIVVDNGSTDGTQEFVKTHFPEVECIQSNKNLGFGKANNLGIEKAYQQGADFFYLMNQDTWIFPDTLQQLISAHESNKNFGILSPVHLAGNEEVLDFGFQNYIRRNTITNTLLSDLFLQKNTLKNAYPLDFVNAAAWLLPKSTIEKVGGFNPLFFHYGEDRDYISRCKLHGLDIGFVPNCFMVHDRVQHAKPLLKKTTQFIKIQLDLTNPIAPIAASEILKSESKKLFQHALKLQFGLAKHHYKNIVFLINNKKTILENKKTILQTETPLFLNLKP